MIRMAKPSRAQCRGGASPRVSGIAADSTRDAGAVTQKEGRVGCYLLVQLGPMVQDKEHI
jgi:hypothetical protein